MVVNMTEITPRLSKGGIQLRQQVDDSFPDRDRRSDGWIGDTSHAQRPSDHNPVAITGWVRAIDIDRNLNNNASTSIYLADQLRLYAKQHGRITYVIHVGKIASSKKNWAWRPYDGINAHEHHIHVSFDPSTDQNWSFFDIPMLGGKIA